MAFGEEKVSVDRRPVRAHVRADSGADLSRFALAFGQHGGGDLLWLAYVPEGLRNWFGRFADSCESSQNVERPFRICRLPDSPGPVEIALLVARIQNRGQPPLGTELPVEDVSPAVRTIADEIAGGQLHVTTVVLDVHHLPTLIRQLRSARPRLASESGSRPTLGDLDRAVVFRLQTLLTALREANLNVLIATPLLARSDPGRTTLESRLIDAIEAEVDLSLVVARVNAAARPPAISAAASDPASSAPSAPSTANRLRITVQRSNHPGLASGTDSGFANWEEILIHLRSPASWWERLNQTCPRILDRAVRERGEATSYWVDQTQEEFARLARQRGWTVERAASEADRREHWDLSLAREGERYRVDVKAQSRLRRGDAAPQDDWHWLELRGIVDDGWLFAGQADLIAFRTEASFLLVPRLALIAHVYHHVDPEDLVADGPAAEYRIYHRRDRSATRPTGSDRGVLTLVPTNRLRLLAWEEWRIGVGVSTGEQET